jgi:Domain of unknown function (DUF5666)/Domain of unknown function (DUF4382)
MKLNWYLGLLALSSIALLNSCSGVGSTGGCTTNCGGNTANLTISLFDTPPVGTNVLSFTLPIAGITLTPNTGSPVAVATAVSSAEVTRLQTDSTVIADRVSVPTGTYTTISATVGPTSATNNVFLNTSGTTITAGTTSCPNNSICNLPVGAIFTIAMPLSFTLTSNQNQWIGLDFNLNRAITTPSANTIAVDFSQSGVLTATTTPSIGIPSGFVDTIEDFTGIVTAVSSSSITVQSGINGTTLTAAVNSNTEIDLAPVNYSGCTSTALACLTVGSTVSVNSNLAADGSFTATEIDVLNAVAVDEVEGIILPTASNGVVTGVQMILSDKVAVTSSPLSNATYGSEVILTLNTSATFTVDTNVLSSQLTQPVAGFAGTGDLLPGQVVRAQVTGISTDTNGNITATVNNALLRWSRLTGTVNSVSGNVFTVANLPSYIYSLNSTLSLTPQVNTYPNLTAFEGITSLADLQSGATSTVALRALYLNTGGGASYPFQANKIRVP